MKLYGIRRKSDGFMMPVGRRRRGFTHDEPKDPCLFPPRLFAKSYHARAALREWLSGELTVRTYDAGYGDIKETWDYKDTPWRKSEDMEVVTVYLRVKK